MTKEEKEILGGCFSTSVCTADSTFELIRIPDGEACLAPQQPIRKSLENLGKLLARISSKEVLWSHRPYLVLDGPGIRSGLTTDVRDISLSHPGVTPSLLPQTVSVILSASVLPSDLFHRPYGTQTASSADPASTKTLSRKKSAPRIRDSKPAT